MSYKLVIRFNKDQVLQSCNSLEDLIPGGELLLLVGENDTIEVTPYTREYNDVCERVRSMDRGGPLVARRYFVEERLRNEENPRQRILLRFEITEIDQRLEQIS